MKSNKDVNRIIYWMALLVLIISNLVVAVVLIPLLLALNPFPLYLIVMLVGVFIGLIFNHLIKDVEHLERKHHLFAGILIPVVGVVDLFIVVAVANKLAKILLIPTQNDPLTVSLVFVASFLFPYVVSE